MFPSMMNVARFLNEIIWAKLIWLVFINYSIEMKHCFSSGYEVLCLNLFFLYYSTTSNIFLLFLRQINESIINGDRLLTFFSDRKMRNTFCCRCRCLFECKWMCRSLSDNKYCSRLLVVLSGHFQISSFLSSEWSILVDEKLLFKRKSAMIYLRKTNWNGVKPMEESIDSSSFSIVSSQCTWRLFVGALAPLFFYFVLFWTNKRKEDERARKENMPWCCSHSILVRRCWSSFS